MRSRSTARCRRRCCACARARTCGSPSTNSLDEDTSIHWHGLLLPFQMDGVPGISFPGIRPRETFVYEFPVRQSGTYWYHSHSGLQEQMGHYGPIVIDPAGADPVAYDREHVLVLSDWSFMHPHEIIAQAEAGGRLFQPAAQTLAGPAGRRARARMSAGGPARCGRGCGWIRPTSSTSPASTYTYLINGHGPQENWTGLFRPGERVRLRIINASAMTIFNVRIPGLPMTVVQADGAERAAGRRSTSSRSRSPRPMTSSSARPRTAPTPSSRKSIDRSGMGRATLAPRLGMTADGPAAARRPRPDA